MTFEVIPSIDLLKGQVVRLERGELGSKTVFGEDPVDMAIDWEGQGAPRLHVVDLDGAMSGDPANASAIGGIIKSIAIPVQVAGGIRMIATAEEWLAAGADRVVIGTRALNDPEFLAEAVERLGEHLVVAPDAKGGEVRTDGWTQGTGEDVIDAVRRLANAGVPRLLVTDISTDGMLSGPNAELFTEVTDASGLPVIASGGVSSIDDLKVLAENRAIEGAVVGRALYVGAFDLGDAIKALA